MGYVRGKWYDKGNSFKCQLKQNGGASSTTAANPPNGGAKAWDVGTTLYYVKQSSKSNNYPVAVCGTSGAPWTDGWYRADIFPWATYTITFDPQNGSATYTSTKTYGTNLAVNKPSKADTKSNGYVVTYQQNGWPNALGTSVAQDTTSYAYSKWTTKADGSGDSVVDAASDAGAAYEAGAPASYTLYAQYTPTVTRGSVTLKSPTADGYVFKNWQDTSTGTTYNAGQTITPTSNMTLKAVWDYDQATAYVKSSGAWTKGKVYYKENGAWVKAKKIYTKVNGAWVEGKA